MEKNGLKKLFFWCITNVLTGEIGWRIMWK